MGGTPSDSVERFAEGGAQKTTCPLRVPITVGEAAADRLDWVADLIANRYNTIIIDPAPRTVPWCAHDRVL